MCSGGRCFGVPFIQALSSLGRATDTRTRCRCVPYPFIRLSFSTPQYSDTTTTDQKSLSYTDPGPESDHKMQRKLASSYAPECYRQWFMWT